MNEENNPKQTREEEKPAELTEQDLEQVAGGGATVSSAPPKPWKIMTDLPKLL